MPLDLSDATYCLICGAADFLVTVEEHDRDADHVWKPGSLEEWYEVLEGLPPDAT